MSHFPKVQLLLSDGIKSNIITDSNHANPLYLNVIIDQENFPLRIVTYTGKIDIIKFLLSKHTNIETLSPRYKSLLDINSIQENLYLLKMLLSNGLYPINIYELKLLIKYLGLEYVFNHFAKEATVKMKILIQTDKLVSLPVINIVKQYIWSDLFTDGELLKIYTFARYLTVKNRIYNPDFEYVMKNGFYSYMN